MNSLGICIGSSSIGIVLLEGTPSSASVLYSKNLSHDGDPRRCLIELLEEVDVSRIDHLAVTGKKLRHSLDAPGISEPEAIERAYAFFRDSLGEVQHIVSAGGESFVVYHMAPGGQMLNVNTGNKCASGTGEFFVQQLKRMDLGLEDQEEWQDSTSSYKVAGRCSVFCKSDCTHALNKGVPKQEVVAGLSEMMAGKILELLPREGRDRLLLIGGTSRNQAMVRSLEGRVSEVIIPPYAEVFEALGVALWAAEQSAPGISAIDSLFKEKHTSFHYLQPLQDAMDKVRFQSSQRGRLNAGDRLILGLDVGSTTTKAVLIREADSRIVAQVYLRTNGDPIRASRECYSALAGQLDQSAPVIGLGVTGSGRQIAGLHALTPAVVNEIIAHATAAVYYDPGVDTIFEIGGQDAKYTYITNGVASDYAMNEACSAGTGSFLEEAALESLDLRTEEIGPKALISRRPPNFSDQCSAFINSDIKSAIQEGIGVEDIAAGLVYSVCMNYNNRVRGSRPVGHKIFMQGGVCYNQAVPLAMAMLTGKEIIVPPDPGLMGAFGVALVVAQRLQNGLLEEAGYDLADLAGREVEYRDPFICAGGKERCDRKCSINRILIENKVYTFGGACNKYYGIKGEKLELDMDTLDLVQLRERMVFQTYSRDYALNYSRREKGRTLAINRSLLTNSLYPLYYNYFYHLGYDVVLNDKIDPEGIDRKGSAFCYPVEISHGGMAELLKLDADVYFLPHVRSYPVDGGWDSSVTCPFVQAEAYYLTSSFPELKDKKVLSPVLDFAEGFTQGEAMFLEMGRELGESPTRSRQAFELAVQAQEAFYRACLEMGEAVLTSLQEHPDEMALVLFGRPYNAFSRTANMGIPHKFASRGWRIVPHDFILPLSTPAVDRMYWSMGQTILKTARLTAAHEQLYGVYISNFSCGPDSFVISYFREIMGSKPSLTLELDSHTADAGVDTRIEAFLDVVDSYRALRKQPEPRPGEYRSAQTHYENKVFWIEDSAGKKYQFTDPHVKLYLPSMGDTGTRALAAAFRYAGVNAVAAPPAKDRELQLGRGHTSCKECLPLQITVGSLLSYLEDRPSSDELLVYFMPETSGPCRFGQYNILIQSLLEKRRIRDVALFSLSSDNAYAGLSTEVILKTWQAVLISDVLDEVYSALLVLAADQESAQRIFSSSVDRILSALETSHWKVLKQVLEQEAQVLANIPLKGSLEDTPQVALVGEIFVRRDDLSRGNMVRRLADKGVIVKAAPVSEWLYYTDYIMKKKLVDSSTLLGRITTTVKGYFKSHYEKSIKFSLAKSGLYRYQLVDVDKVVSNVSDLISPRLTGEAILTIGTALTEVAEEVAGILSIGPFGCMPSRIAESILKENIHVKKLEIAHDRELVQGVLEHYPQLPFMAIEVDGNVFTQGTESRLETFVLQVKRVHQKMREVKRKK